MVVKCKKCNKCCINWAENHQTCKCGNVKGFSQQEECIAPITENDSDVLIWIGQEQQWQQYNSNDKYTSEMWAVYSGNAFAI